MHVFFSGIGGVGIGPLAEIAQDAGFEVHGSDARESLVTKELNRRNIEIEIGQDGYFLKAVHAKSPIDWFVHTSALPESHPELILAKELGIKTAKRDELLAYIIKQKNLSLVAVAGTHGKTTTTGMMVWAMMQLGIPVSYSIGSTIGFGPSGKFDPASKYFVYECDEFDRNFLHFEPELSLMTSIDYDHPDTYPTEAEYVAAFNQFIEKSNHTILWSKDKQNGIRTKDSDWVLADEDVEEVGLAGAHNRRNATLVLKALEKLGFNSDAKTVLASFPGTNRRFEKLAKNLYSDYGHHPVEIAATLQMAREISDKVVLVYQPHQNVRQHEIKDQYTDCFELAEEVFWLPTYLSREDPDLPVLQPEELTEKISNKNAVHFAELDDQLWQKLLTKIQAGSLVLCMGAGSIDEWARKNVLLPSSQS